MKRIVSLTLASVVAFGALATIVSPAAADGPRYYQGWHAHPWGGQGEWHGDHDGWGVGGALLGGTVLGLALGATLYDPPPPPPPPAYVYVPYPPPPAPVYRHYVYADHIAWCTAHYPGYNGETDTFVGSDGAVYRCPAPY